jgi:hypothetical protein
MDTRVWHQVSLELSKIDVESTIESERCSDGRHDLSDQTIQVGVCGSFDVQVTTANVVDGFVVNHESTIGVFQGGVSGQDGVVWFDNSGGYLWGGVDGEFKFGFLSIINGETFHKEGGESGSGASTEGVEDKESLKTGTLIGKLSDAVKYEINDFLSNGVVTTSVVVCGIFLSGDQLFGVEKLTVSSGSDLIDDSWFQVDEYSTRDMFTSTSFTEESVERVITAPNSFITGHLTIRLDTMFQTVQLPTGVTDLYTGLSNVD